MGMTGKDLSVVPHHVGLSVPDLAASVAWYRDNLGFSVEKEMFLEHISARIAFLINGNFRLELFEVAGAAPLPEERRSPDADLKTHGTKHLALAVKDVPALLAFLKQRGVDIVMEGEVDGTPMAFIRDNSGILLELNTAGTP